MRILLKTLLQPMLNNNIDYLVLGCTHYPYLIPMLLELLPSRVNIIDSGHAVAKQTKLILETHGLLNLSTNTSTHVFYTNGNKDVLQSLLVKPFNVDFLDF